MILLFFAKILADVRNRAQICLYIDKANNIAMYKKANVFIS